MADAPNTPTGGSNPKPGENQILNMRAGLSATPPGPSAPPKPSTPVVPPTAPTINPSAAPTPAPKIPTGGIPTGVTVAPMGQATPPPVMKEPGLNIPVKPIFDADEPMFTPSTVTAPTRTGATTTITAPLGTATPIAGMPTGGSVDALIATHQGKKKTGMIIGGIAGLIVLAAAGYFVAPMIIGTNAPVVVAPSPVTPVEPTPPPPPAFPSIFTVDPIKRVPVQIEGALTMTALVQAFQKEAAASGSVELQMTNGSSTEISFVEIISAIAPTLKAQTEELFAGTSTVYVYADENGAWPGYAASLKPDADPVKVKAWFAALEKTKEKQNFFITNPGTFAAFKDGFINNTYPDRYSTATKAGASLGYLILPEKQVVFVSTSFAGLRDGLRLAGL